jgi:sulfur-carrier protein
MPRTDSDADSSNALVLRLNEDRSFVLDQHCATVGEALTALGSRAPGVLDRIVDEQGVVRQHVNVFLNETSIRDLEGLNTRVADGSTIYLLASVSGG